MNSRGFGYTQACGHKCNPNRSPEKQKGGDYCVSEGGNSSPPAKERETERRKRENEIEDQKQPPARSLALAEEQLSRSPLSFIPNRLRNLYCMFP